jgi:hypothetical protein
LKVDTNDNDPFSPDFSKVKKVNDKGQKWFELEVSNESRGTFIYAKSYEIEEYFKPFGDEYDDNYELRNGYKPYKYPSGVNSWNKTREIDTTDIDVRGGNLNYSYEGIFNQWNYESLWLNERNNVPNLSFLRAVGLSEGVKFKINNIYTIPERSRFLSLTTKIIREFFLDFLRPNTKRLILTYRSEDSDMEN